MDKILTSYKSNFTNKIFLTEIFFGLLMLVGSMFINFYAGIYATERASNSVTDVILSNLRTFDVDGLFIYGGFMIFIIITLFCLYEPKKIPFILKSISFFVLTRSVFVSLTHIAPFPSQIAIASTNFLNHFIFSGDLFFSGHTGLPFLMALIYWKQEYVRYFFLAMSVFFGAIVLMGHLHYTIDVLSAFYITYSIYNLNKYFFKKDYDLFHS
ncbi:MAG: phosphatase PAP2-related protein [Candidatus Nomurabacteria bacterium]|nr:phosphatase PAP2-related protein [Candidatus Nomurabacteria bacterium]